MQPCYSFDKKTLLWILVLDNVFRITLFLENTRLGIFLFLLRTGKMGVIKSYKC